MCYNQTNYLGLTVEVKYLGSILVPTTVDKCVIFSQKDQSYNKFRSQQSLKVKKRFYFLVGWLVCLFVF